MKLLGPPYSLFQYALTSLFYNLFSAYSNNKRQDYKNKLNTNAASQRRTIWRKVTTTSAFVPNERKIWSFSFYGNERRYSSDLFCVKRLPNYVFFFCAINTRILPTVTRNTAFWWCRTEFVYLASCFIIQRGKRKKRIKYIRKRPRLISKTERHQVNFKK